MIDIRPFDLGRVFGMSGGLPLAKRAPQRQAYRLLELERWSRFLGLPLNLHPAFFPVDGDPAARLIIAAKLAQGNDAAMRLAGAVRRAVWAEERNIADAGTLCGHRRGDAAWTAPRWSKRRQRGGAGRIRPLHRRRDRRQRVRRALVYASTAIGYWGQDRLDFVERALQQA